MPETVILPTPTAYKHFIPTPTPFVSVLATPSAPAGVGVAKVAPVGVQFDLTLAVALAIGVVIAGLNRLARRKR